jgi:hypothetical protein
VRLSPFFNPTHPMPASTPVRKDYILFGAIAVIFSLYVGLHTGGSSQSYAIAIVVGCILGTARAVKRFRHDSKRFTRNRVTLNAAIASWIAASFVGLVSGGPVVAAEALGYALAMGSFSAWGFALIALELFGDRSDAKPLIESNPTS